MKHRWFRLDNTAKIFPSIVSKRLTTVFRLSVELKDPIDLSRLQSALESALCRYPYFKTVLKRGLFWSYLQESTSIPLVAKEREKPCRKMSKWFDRRFLFRVLVYGGRISVEFSHILTDGTGALLFLTELLNNYCGVDSVPVVTEEIRSAEEEDSYLRYYKSDTPPPRAGGVGAFHLPGPMLDADSMRIITGLSQVSEMKKVAKEKGLTITELLLTIYLWTLQDFNQANRKKRYLKPIRLMVPVNLRKLYPSCSIRNFFLSVLPGIDLRLGDYSFDEIGKIVHNHLELEIHDKNINQQISKNVGTEQNLFIKLIPQFLKAPIERVIYNHYSNKKHSGVVTNLGVINLPESVSEQIIGFRFIPNPNPVTKINMGIVSFKDQIAISFGSLTQYRTIERVFFTTLRELGIPVTIETNE